MDRRGKAFIRKLKANREDPRHLIDRFVYQHGYREFVKVKIELESSINDMNIRARLEDALWTKAEHLSHVQTQEGIFNMLHVKFNGKFVEVPGVYIDSFPDDSKLIFVMPTM